MRLSISLVDNEAEFLKLGEKWNKLLDRSASQSIFLTWEWIEAWWNNYKHNGYSLFVLLAENNKELIGIAPLYLRSVKFLKLFNLRILFFLGDGSWDSDYLDFIIASGCENMVMGEFCRYLYNSDSWHLSMLNEIPETSRNIGYLESWCERDKFVVSKNDSVCAYAPLSEDWQSYLSGLKPRFRTKVRSSLKRLESDLKAEFKRCDDESSLGSALQALFTLHRKRWALRYEAGVFEFPGKRGFYWDMARALLHKDCLRLYTLRLGERIIACQLGFEYNGTFYHLQEGFDPAYEDLSVSVALRAHVFRDCLARGLKAYDFLGGIGRHKTDWGARPKKSIRLALGKPGAINRLYLELPALRERSKETIKGILPRRLIELRGRWLERSRKRRFVTLRSP
jgi:CelD/BcsL family acetyltransferase involved in cellulose biosynthesis